MYLKRGCTRNSPIPIRPTISQPFGFQAEMHFSYGTEVVTRGCFNKSKTRRERGRAGTRVCPLHEHDPPRSPFMHICESDGLYFDQLKSCTSHNGFTNKDKDTEQGRHG